MSISNKIFWNFQPHEEHLGDKVSIIGAGMVGTATAVCLLGTAVTKNLVIVDPFGDKVNGEVLDFQHGSLFLKYPRITGGNDFLATQGSKLTIITAGVRQEQGESRISLAQRNADIMSKLVPEVIRYSPDTIILMLGNPCDVLTYVAWRISGLPPNRVIGAGTTLDTQRFRLELAKKFSINPANIHAWIIGEHGDNSVPIWSSVNIAGLRMKQINPQMGHEEDPEGWAQIYRDVVGASSVIQELKGYNNWGVGMCAAAISKAILRNQLAVFPVSVNARGKYGIKEDIFVPLPCILGFNGVYDIVHIHMTEEEQTAFRDTVMLLKHIQDAIKIKGSDISCKCRRCRT